MAEIHSLRILHLSDLHERVALRRMKSDRKAIIRARAASRRRVLDEGNFWEVIEGIRRGGRTDLLCFTGDVADTGLEEEYKSANARIARLIGEAALTRPRVFL